MDEKPTRLFLLRHGDVDITKRIFYGQMDVPLSDEGKLKSIKTAKYLSSFGIGKILSSDLSRCKFLAEEIKRYSLCNDIEYLKELREVDFGLWTGLSWDEIELKYPGELNNRYSNLSHYQPPMGESLTMVQTRVMKIIKCLSFNGENVAIVAHGGVNRCIIYSLMGYDLSNFFIIDQDYCCINIIDFYKSSLVIKRLNYVVQ